MTVHAAREDNGMTSAFARRWIVGSVSVALVTPVLFALWIQHEVQREYAEGVGVSTEGDSIGLPIAGFTVLLWLFLLSVTLLVWLVRWFRSRR